MLTLEARGFVSVERRFRLVDRWDGRYRHDRTNVYRFVDGAPVASVVTPLEDAASEPTASSPPRPNVTPTPPRPTTSSAPPSLPRPTSDPYWDIFEAAFVVEHRAAYGKDSAPGSVRQDHLRAQASDALNEIASECIAWARQPEHRLDVHPLRVAEELARRLARAWLRLPGRDNRHRDRGHPLGWLCGDLSRKLCDEAVESWKRAQRRLLPKDAPAVQASPTSPTSPPSSSSPASSTSPDEAAIKHAENTAIMRLVLQGVGFDEALQLGRAEGAKMRAALALTAPPLTRPAAAELREPLVDPASRAPPE